METVYRTVKEAHDRLCLDRGFNPINGRITKARLAEYGYIVDAREYDRIHDEEYNRTHCRQCGIKLTPQNQFIKWNMYPENICWDCSCKDAICECNHGHKWKASEGDKCPVCGEYYV